MIMSKCFKWNKVGTGIECFNIAHSWPYFSEIQVFFSLCFRATMLTYTNSFKHVEKLVSYSSYGMQNGFGSIQTESADWRLKLLK